MAPGFPRGPRAAIDALGERVDLAVDDSLLDFCQTVLDLLRNFRVEVVERRKVRSTVSQSSQVESP
jgi:hypothetical protein